MSPIADDLRTAAQGKALVREVSAAHISTSTAQVHTMDIVSMTSDQQDFTASFTLQPIGGKGSLQVAAIVLWFDVEFSDRFCRKQPAVLSTSPHATPTHWAQTVLPLPQSFTLVDSGCQEAASTQPSSSQKALNAHSETGSAAEPVTCIIGRMSMARSKSQHRTLDISLEYEAMCHSGQVLKDVVSFSMDVTGEDH